MQLMYFSRYKNQYIRILVLSQTQFQLLLFSELIRFLNQLEKLGRPNFNELLEIGL